MDTDTQRRMILGDSLWKVAWRLSPPAIIAMLLYGFNGVMDAVFVGRYCGESALAGVSIAGNLTSFAMGFGALVGVGAGSVLSIAIGAGDKRTQERVIANLNGLSLTISAGAIAVLLLIAEPFLGLMGASGEVLDHALRYFRLMLVGLPFTVHGLGVNMVVRAEGRMGKAALMMGSGLVVNIACNYLFMGPLGLGVAGAAWGTNVGMLVYSIVGLRYLASGKASFEAKPFAIGMSKAIAGKIMSTGSSSLIMSIMTLIQGAIIFNVISRLGGSFDIAFYGASLRLMTFMLTPIFGLMRALQPVVGINFGAGRYDRVKTGFWTFLGIATILVVPFWAAMTAFASPVLGFMMPGSVFSAGDIANFRIMIAVLPLLPLVFMVMTLYPAMGKGGPAAMMGLARQLFLYVPVMLIVPARFGLGWVYRGSLAIDTVVVLLALVMVLIEFSRLGFRKATESEAIPSAAAE